MHFRYHLPRDGAQHPRAADEQRARDRGALRRAPRPAIDGQLADWPGSSHRRARLGAVHREVPARGGHRIFPMILMRFYRISLSVDFFLKFIHFLSSLVSNVRSQPSITKISNFFHSYILLSARVKKRLVNRPKVFLSFTFSFESSHFSFIVVCYCAMLINQFNGLWSLTIKCLSFFVVVFILHFLYDAQLHR